MLISKKAHLNFTHSQVVRQASEKAKGKRKIGSTLKGIGPTYMDKTGRNGLRIGDISSQNFKTRFERLREKHFQLLDEIDADYNNLEIEFLSSIEFLKGSSILIVNIILTKPSKKGKKYLQKVLKELYWILISVLTLS